MRKQQGSASLLLFLLQRVNATRRAARWALRVIGPHTCDIAFPPSLASRDRDDSRLNRVAGSRPGA
ncbi:hypothetical protein D3871_02010 [Noviherbaspirillum saxi]|uniref:Uncharacterized protein n=1 Tax=Noviherbaspirillum saxi TaxID=2320863 RepID=A0A3A3FTC6_9BURK|nr:hypothetical protein D3871_02010 [Noviherbaspirillum saxi]